MSKGQGKGKGRENWPEEELISKIKPGSRTRPNVKRNKKEAIQLSDF